METQHLAHCPLKGLLQGTDLTKHVPVDSQ